MKTNLEDVQTNCNPIFSVDENGTIETGELILFGIGPSKEGSKPTEEYLINQKIDGINQLVDKIKVLFDLSEQEQSDLKTLIHNQNSNAIEINLTISG